MKISKAAGDKKIFKCSYFLNIWKEMARKFNVIIEQGEDGYLISDVIELPGCHTQAKTYDELIKRTKEAIEVYLEGKGAPKSKSKFLSLQQIEVGVA